MNEGILSVIGNTPVVELTRILSPLHFRLWAKLESFNPGGSMKDRPAINILKEAFRAQLIDNNSVIVESSSGNMGVGLAQACAYYGLKFICVVDPKTTEQNIRLIEAYGAEIDRVVEPDPVTGEFLQARLNRVAEVVATRPHAFWPNQYSNIHNPLAHHQTMDEVVKAFDGKVDYLFCATSTFGTLRGCAEYTRNNGLHTKIIAVDAVGSVIFGGQNKKRLVPGHGASVRPVLFQDNLACECIHVTDVECIVGCHLLVQKEAILAGGSSGAIMMAIDNFKEKIHPGSVCVAIFPDRGDRYLDTIYSKQWVEKNFGICHTRLLLRWRLPYARRGHVNYQGTRGALTPCGERA